MKTTFDNDTVAAKDVVGTLLHLQRLSTEDGPGIRTTVFFKGCPLRCAWCHNPESLNVRTEVQWYKNRCIVCDSCIEICELNGIARSEDGIERNRAVCSVCGDCTEACPTGAMEKLGMEWTVRDLANELAKDRAYFDKSGGGVTLSGGEPALQPRFTLELTRALKDRGVQVALDTCGLCPWETLETLAVEADIVLYDLKMIDSEQHEQWTGVGNERILENLKLLAESLRRERKRLWIRTPLIPGATVSEANLKGISAFLAENLDDLVERWELCAFNNLCRDKYERLGLTWRFADTPLMTQVQLDQAGAWARSGGFADEKTFVTGTARLEHS